MLGSVRWQSALEQLQLDLSDEQQQKLWDYLNLLQRWNKVYNLTAVRDEDQMLPLHLWDSLSVVNHVQGERVLDVGSGGGLPGIPLSIVYPERSFTLLDTNGKKTRFIQQAAVQLGLKNVEVIQTRVESWQPEQRFDAVISRAFASVLDFLNNSGQHLVDGGTLYAMKGRYPEDELASLPKDWLLETTYTLEVPELSHVERHLLLLRRTQ